MSKDLIIGPQGSGKTTLGIYLARKLQAAIPGLTIYTNMNVANDSHLITISDLSEIPLSTFEERRKPKILLVDEAMFSLDSRSHASAQNKIWSRLQALFRKANFVKVIFMTHKLNLIDNRMREQLDFIYMARKNKTHFQYLALDMLTQKQKPFFLPKSETTFQFANFDTYDFPLPISVQGLENHDIFKLTK